ncbi:darcynin family protein [Parasedimentitalea huanghaiensis]|uniref:Uncharacterized protein n=1 Tax=Parasedimentitalea huanghaiensis TaxID=2682100 RepID=A0A6L6WMH8_9RHOB|nr:darcynin family protein [Zongyanglinia huanghaiensis]MVO17197.1 hypothetical protein [Zongyanglinia huanghaiensis]
MTLTIFLFLRANPSWLQLTRKQRAKISKESLGATCSAPGMKLRYFDAEAFHARISDIAMIEAEDPKAYYFAIEALRDSALLAEGYFELLEIIPSYEDGFRAYEAAHVA